MARFAERSGRSYRLFDYVGHPEAERVLVLVGSGATPENVRDYAAADGVIVGSALKRDGLWSHPLDPARVAAMRAAFPE